jgi:murein DD-endopeptidase MepM/ murein hydrolase activator NlpD
MPLDSLAKHARRLATHCRLAARTLVRRWQRLPRATRSRVELAGVFTLLPLSAAIAAVAAAPSALDLDGLQSQPVVQAIATPPLDTQLAALANHTDAFVREARVQRGEPVMALLTRLGIDDDPAARFVRTDPQARPLLRLAPGRFVQASVAEDGRLLWLRAYTGDDKGNLHTRVLLLRPDAAARGGFTVNEATLALQRRVELRSGEISGSLFAAADAADVPDFIAQQMIDALESEVDFHRNLRRGDSFRVIFEGLYAGGEYMRPGRLLAVEFINQGKSVEAYWFDDGSKHGGYFAADGRPMKRAFLASPLEYTRLTSGFSDSRIHPVFGYDAAHRGIDYSAPAGTKVRAVAGGVVEFAGWQRGYGNVVEIKHDAKHATLYAHLQGFAPGVVKGARIAQGDLLGFVGATGWATGPHLHYEVKINGTQVNPLTAALPGAEPLAASQRAALATAVAPLREQLALLERIRVAANPQR